MWAHVISGNTTIIHLLTGTYDANVSTNNRIFPPTGLSGTAAHTITVQADGEVTSVDGQGRVLGVSTDVLLTSGGSPNSSILLKDSSWYIFQGFNVCCMDGTAGSQISFSTTTTGSSNNIARRIDGWASSYKYNYEGYVSDTLSANNLFEDVAFWGNFRAGVQFHDGNPFAVMNATCRRCYVDWDFSEQIGPKNYSSPHYLVHNFTLENFIGRWHGNDSHFGCLALTGGTGTYTQWNNGVSTGLQQNNCDTDQTLVSAGNCGPNVDTCDHGANGNYLGSIFFTLPSDDAHQLASGVLRESQQEKTAYKNVWFINTHASAKGWTMFNCSDLGCVGSGSAGSSGHGNTADSISIVAPGGFVTGSQWTNDGQPTNVLNVTTLGANNIYNGGTGASMCFEYSGGVLGSNKMWPWRMQQRIAADSVASGHDLIDVNALIQTIGGQIPAACGGPQPTPTPSNTPTVTPTAGGPTPTRTPISPICTTVHMDWARYKGWIQVSHGYDCVNNPPPHIIQTGPN